MSFLKLLLELIKYVPAVIEAIKYLIQLIKGQGVQKTLVCLKDEHQKMCSIREETKLV